MSRGPVHAGDVLRAAGALGVTGTAELRALVRAMGLPAEPDPGAAPPAAARPLPAARPRPAAPAPARPGGDRPPHGRYADAARAAAAQNGVPAAVPEPRPRPAAGESADPAAAYAPQHDLLRPAGGSLLTFPPAPGAPDEPAEPADEPQAAAPGGGAQLAAPPGEMLFAAPDGGPERRPAPPWNPRTEQAIMLAVAATEALGSEVDPRRLVGIALRRLGGGLRTGDHRVPYRTRATTRTGLHVLLDRGPAMRPFRHDHAWIARLARRVLPPDQLRILDFRLAQGVSADGGRTWHRTLRLARGTPVLLVSDLGHFRPPVPGRHHASSGEWLAFLRRLLRAGHPVVCVTPFRPEAYPSAVRRAVALVPLDRRISAWSVRGQIRHRLRPGRTT